MPSLEVGKSTKLKISVNTWEHLVRGFKIKFLHLIFFFFPLLQKYFHTNLLLAFPGVDEEKINVAQIIKPTVTFYKDDDYIVVKTETSIHTGEIWYRLGEEYYEKTRDGRDCQVKI